MMIFAKREDVDRCAEIVRAELEKRDGKINNDILNKITEDIMNISYAKGGDFSEKIFRRFVETYVENGLHKKYFM